MSGTHETIIGNISKIKDAIDTFGLNNPARLQDMCGILSSAIDQLPEEMPEIKELLELCLKELTAICQSKAQDPLASVDAIFESLSAAEHYLNDHPSKESFFLEAKQLMDNVASGSLKMAGDENGSGEGLITTLNDAASILLQIGPEDFEELARLAEVLEHAGSFDGCEGDCFDLVIHAFQKAHRLIEKGGAGDIKTIPDDELAEIESAIESAIQVVSSAEEVIDAPVPQALQDEAAFPALPAEAEDREAETHGMRPAAPKGKAPTAAKSEPSHEVEADELSEDFMPADADLELIGEFIAESLDLITNAEEALLSLESDPEDTEAISTVFRAFHNIKGTSAFFELSLMTDFAHHAESLLSQIRDNELRYSGGIPDLALRSVDMVKDLFRLLQDALGGGPFLKPQGYNRLIRILSAPEEAGITDDPDSGPVAEAASPAESVADDIDGAERIVPAYGAALPDAEDADVAAELGEGDDDDEEEDYRPASLPKMPLRAPTRKSPAPPAEAKAGSPQSKQKVVESSIRVPIERLDRFIDMVGELVVSHSMVAQDQVVVSGDHHELTKKVGHTSKIVRELQSMSMSMRMIPLKATFRKMARLVRDLSRKIGKDVRFVSEGEDTEIDRNMVNIINDPLVHMVRNAIDHGIEPPDERTMKGKERQGTLHLSAYHSAGNVVVEVRDDGKGLDREAILSKALDRGLIAEGTNLSEREIYNLIFEPGFSTAKSVSDVSGRGVGMDVVKRNIEAVRGGVEIQSEPGKGSVFKMSLPLTLAIIDGMVVRVGNEKYVIPTISIVRSVQPEPDDLATVLRRGEMLKLQGSLIPLFRLASLFEVSGAERDITQAIVVVVENDGHQAGLIVDELIGSQQIVIKTISEILGNITGISGSAIMPNGRVGLILDVGGLVRLAHEK